MVGTIFTNSLVVLGLILGLIFVLVFPRLLVEIGYLIHLKIVDKDYWEENREQKAFSFKKRLLSILKKKINICFNRFFYNNIYGANR
ncbi:hypothetical protein JZO73_12530 [Enterococcus plantarum]|nr:hypothetical protein [Enterococcus plantarum]